MRRVSEEVARSFPAVPSGAHDVDAMALDMVRRPWEFGVLPMENMFGDDHAVFQPSHCTGPDIAGKGVVNPTATLLPVALMLDWLGSRGAGQAWTDAATELEAAVDGAFAGLRSAEFGGVGRQEVPRAVAERIPA